MSFNNLFAISSATSAAAQPVGPNWRLLFRRVRWMDDLSQTTLLNRIISHSSLTVISLAGLRLLSSQLCRIYLIKLISCLKWASRKGHNEAVDAPVSRRSATRLTWRSEDQRFMLLDDSTSLSNWRFYWWVGWALRFPNRNAVGTINCQLGQYNTWDSSGCGLYMPVYYILKILVSMRLQYFLWDALPKALWPKLSIVW